MPLETIRNVVDSVHAGFSAMVSQVRPVPISSDTLTSLLTVVTVLASVGLGTWLLRAAPALMKLLRDRRQGKLEASAALSKQRRQDQRDMSDHYEEIITRLNRQHDEALAVWTQDRNRLIQERDQASAAHHALAIEAARMQDRLAIYQGIGPEGAERMDPVLVVSGAGRICWVNDPAGTFLGYTTLALLGHSILRVIAPERHEHVRELFRKLVVELMRQPPWYPIRHLVAGVAQRRDGSTIKICIIINGLRIPHKVTVPVPGGEPITLEVEVPAFRLHLRERWENEETAMNVPNISLNSSDGIPTVATTTGEEVQGEEDLGPDASAGSATPETGARP